MSWAVGVWTFLVKICVRSSEMRSKPKHVESNTPLARVREILDFVKRESARQDGWIDNKLKPGWIVKLSVTLHYNALRQLMDWTKTFEYVHMMSILFLLEKGFLKSSKLSLIFQYPTCEVVKSSTYCVY